MANRYWVGGTGTWNDTAKWSTSSGGASGASVPTVSDDVFFDANSASGSFTVSFPATDQNCRTFNALAIDDSMILDLNSNTGNLLVYGAWSNHASLFSVSGNSSGSAGNIQFIGSATWGVSNKLVVTNNVFIPSLIIGSSTNNTWQLDSDLNVGYLGFGATGNLHVIGTTLGSGIYSVINIYAYKVNVVTLQLSHYTTGSNFNFYFDSAWTGNAYAPSPPLSGTGTLTISGNLLTPSTVSVTVARLQGNILNMTSPTAKIEAPTSRIRLSVNALNFTSTAAGQREITGLFRMEYAAYFSRAYDAPSNTWIGSYYTYTRATTFSTAAARGCVFYFNASMDNIDGFPVFNLFGTSQFRYLIKGQSSIKSLSSATTSFKPGSPSISYADFFGINCTNASSLVGTSLGNMGNNNNITFQTARNVYWNQAAGGNWIDNAWALSAGGAVSYDNSPLPQDTAYIVDTGLNASATITINSDETISVIPAIDGLSRTTAATISIGSEVRFIGSSYGTSSSITFSSVSSSYYLYLSPIASAVTINIAGTVNYLRLISSWTYYSGTSSFVLSRNLTVSETITVPNGTLSFTGYTVLCKDFYFEQGASYLNGLNFTGGGTLQIKQLAYFYNNTSSSVVSEVIGTSNIEIGFAGFSSTLRLPDSTNSDLSVYGRKLNIKVITTNAFSIQGITGSTNVETNILQVGKLDFSSCSSLVSFGYTTSWNSVAIYGDFTIGTSTRFDSYNPLTGYVKRQFWVMSADANSPSSTTITTNGNAIFADSTAPSFTGYSTLVFNAGDQGTGHEFILADNLTIFQSSAGARTAAIGLVSGKLNLNGKTLTTPNFIIGPYYYVRWATSTTVPSWQDIYQKQLLFNGGSISIRGNYTTYTPNGLPGSSWNVYGWECVSSPSLVSIQNGTATGTVSLKPTGDGYARETWFRGGCTTSNTSSAPSVTPITYPCTVQNLPESALSGASGSTVSISGNIVFNGTLQTQTPSLYPSFKFNPTAVIVLNGDFTMVGGSSTKGKLTSTTTTPATLTKNGTNVDPTNVNVSYTNVSPTGKWIGRQSYGVQDLGNNTGWIFTTTITNNNISENVSLLATDSVLVVVTIVETIQASSSSIQLKYGEINENMIIYQYSEPTVQFIWNNIDTDSPSLPDWDSNNSV